MTDLSAPPIPLPPPTLDGMLCFAIYEAGHDLTRAYQPLLQELGLTYPQYLVMIALWEAEDRSVSQLGAALGLDSGTLTPLLKRLEAKGLIRRTRLATDERQVRLHLTEAGERLRPEAHRVHECIALACGMDAASIRALMEGLARLRAGLAAAQKG